jgi:hypothetical protein
MACEHNLIMSHALYPGAFRFARMPGILLPQTFRAIGILLP